MIDQNKIYGQTQEETPEQAETAQNVPEIPTSQPPPSSPTVIVPPEDKVPKWFYVVFGITLLAFFAGTILLVSTIKKRGAAPLQTSLSPSPFPTVTTTTGEITPSPVSIEATDPVILKLNNQGASDEVADLEADLENTDLSTINQAIIMLDEQMGISYKEDQ